MDIIQNLIALLAGVMDLHLIQVLFVIKKVILKYTVHDSDLWRLRIYPMLLSLNWLRGDFHTDDFFADLSGGHMLLRELTLDALLSRLVGKRERRGLSKVHF